MHGFLKRALEPKSSEQLSKNRQSTFLKVTDSNTTASLGPQKIEE